MKEKDKTKEQLIEELEKLHQELHLYKMIVEKMPLALTVWRLEDLDNPGSFRLLACNPQIEEAAGAPYREFVGTTVRETFPSSLETEGPHIYAEAVRSGQVRELPDLRFPGDEQTAAGVYSVTTVPLGGRIAAVFCQNITERKQAERLLQALNQAALAMERALTPEEIFTAVARELKKLGFSCIVFLTGESQSRLLIRYVSYEARAIKALEKLTGFKIENFSIPSKPQTYTEK